LDLLAKSKNKIGKKNVIWKNIKCNNKNDKTD